jgi:hypothetical protein
MGLLPSSRLKWSSSHSLVAQIRGSSPFSTCGTDDRITSHPVELWARTIIPHA